MYNESALLTEQPDYHTSIEVVSYKLMHTASAWLKRKHFEVLHRFERVSRRVAYLIVLLFNILCAQDKESERLKRVAARGRGILCCLAQQDPGCRQFNQQQQC